jgi:hypothetical protein
MSTFTVPVNLAACNVLIPLYGMKGAALAQWATAASLPITVWYVSSRLKVSWPYRDTARIIMACVMMAVGVTFLNRYLEGAGFIPVVVLLGAGFYFGLLFMLRAVRGQDLELIGSLWSRRGLPGWLGRPLRLLRGVRPQTGPVPARDRATADRPEIAEAGGPGAAG